MMNEVLKLFESISSAAMDKCISRRRITNRKRRMI